MFSRSAKISKFTIFQILYAYICLWSLSGRLPTRSGSSYRPWWPSFSGPGWRRPSSPRSTANTSLSADLRVSLHYKYMKSDFIIPSCLFSLVQSINLLFELVVHMSVAYPGWGPRC